VNTITVMAPVTSKKVRGNGKKNKPKSPRNMDAREEKHEAESEEVDFVNPYATKRFVAPPGGLVADMVRTFSLLDKCVVLTNAWGTLQETTTQSSDRSTLHSSNKGSIMSDCR
jgi:hypothetical protein